MLTKSGLAAAIAAVVCAAAGLWWHYEELIVIAVAAGVADRRRAVELACPPRGADPAHDRRATRRPRRPDPHGLSGRQPQPPALAVGR